MAFEGLLLCLTMSMQVNKVAHITSIAIIPFRYGLSSMIMSRRCENKRMTFVLIIVLLLTATLVSNFIAIDSINQFMIMVCLLLLCSYVMLVNMVCSIKNPIVSVQERYRQSYYNMLERSTIHSMPISDDYREPFSTYKAKNLKNKESCSICLSTLKSKLVSTECNHIFHKKCIKEWTKRKMACPLCNKQF